MKAMVSAEYGSPDVLEYLEVGRPRPRDDEVLIRVCAASANAADWRLLRGRPFLMRFLYSGFPAPRFTILGADVAGVVEAVGKNAKLFHSGDEVFGDISACGWGAFAEYVCAKETALAAKPVNLSFEQAAAVPLAGVTALKALVNKGKIQAGQRVLIHGASGGVGLFAVQIAKSFGAEVTAVCSTGHIDLVRSLGADHVIDYTREDFTRQAQRYDLILVANGNLSLADYHRALGPEGVCVVSGGSMAQVFQVLFLGPLVSKMGKKKFYSLTSTPDPESLNAVKALLEAGKVVPVIDRRYPLTGVAEALRYLETGHAKGKVVIV